MPSPQPTLKPPHGHTPARVIWVDDGVSGHGRLHLSAAGKNSVVEQAGLSGAVKPITDMAVTIRTIIRGEKP